MKVINEANRVILHYDNDTEKRVAELLSEDYKRLAGTPPLSARRLAPAPPPLLQKGDAAQHVDGTVGTIDAVHYVPQNGSHVYDFRDPAWRGTRTDPKTGAVVPVTGRVISVPESDLLQYDLKARKAIPKITEEIETANAEQSSAAKESAA